MPHSNFSLLKFLAAGLGSGWLPKAPGTWGSLASLLPAYFIIAYFGLSGLILATGLVTVLGFMICAKVLPQLVAQGKSHDPGWIVIDEWAGLWLCMALILAAQPQIDMVSLFLLSFVLFRIFDIFKPFPIKRFETWGPDWLSIMHDDLIAGIMAAFTAILLLRYCIQ